MWRKELPVFPVERECTDRVILVVAKCRNVDIHIIGVLVLSTKVDEFRHTLEHIEKFYGTYSANDPVVIFSDFNAHLSNGYGYKNPVNSNERRRVLEQFLNGRRLISVSSQMDGIEYSY